MGLPLDQSQDLQQLGQHKTRELDLETLKRSRVETKSLRPILL